MTEWQDTDDAVNNAQLYHSLSKLICCEVGSKANGFACQNCKRERISSHYFYELKKYNFPKFSVKFGYKNETIPIKFHFSTGRIKPLIEKGKLKVIGSKYYHETKLKCSKNSFSHVVLNHELGKNDKVMNFSDSSTGVFIKDINTEIMEDFKSLSLKGNAISLKDSQIVCPELNSSSFSNEHRSEKLSKVTTSHRRGRRKLTDKELPDLNALSISDAFLCNTKLSCAEQARNYEDISTDELAAYLDNHLHFPKKMSAMAEMMYT